jgi:hypothetical protein
MGFRKFKGKAELHIPRPTVTENLNPETFPQQFEFLGKEVSTFLKCLNEFPEFTDEAVNSSILSFEGDLKVIFSFDQNIVNLLHIVLGLLFERVRG